MYDRYLLPNPFFRIRLTPNIEQPDIPEVYSESTGSAETSRRTFEDLFSKFVGTKGGLAVNSGRSALSLALRILRIKRGDEVIIPSFVCGAVADAVLNTGATPVLTDVRSTDGSIDVAKLEGNISKKTKAIVAVHYLGLPCDIGEISEFAKKKGLVTIEDCAHSLGSEYERKALGTFGEMAFFSFGPDKPMTTGTGGFLTSRFPEFSGMIDECRTSVAEPDHREESESKRILAENRYFHRKRTYGLASLTYFPLVNFQSLIMPANHIVKPTLMSHFSALAGIQQIKTVVWVLRKRLENTITLQNIMQKSALLENVAYTKEKKPVFIRFTALAKSNHMRELLMREFKSVGVEAGPINWRTPLHKSSYYSKIVNTNSDFQGTNDFCNRFINIPCHPFVDSQDFERIEEAAKISFR